MGKSISGKEFGKGLDQRRDGLYYARYKDDCEKWQEKCFKRLSDAQNWQQEQMYLLRHAAVHSAVSDMTADERFCYWMDTQLTGLSPNTRRNYWERYEKNAQSILGKKHLSEVKSMHCKEVFNRMSGLYAGSTICQAYITLGSMFKAPKKMDSLTNTLWMVYALAVL